MIQITRFKNGRSLGTKLYRTPIQIAAVLGRHIPDVPGFSKADWLRKELSENNGVFETRLGCQLGHSIQFKEINNDAA